jgi:hypothetical protein
MNNNQEKKCDYGPHCKDPECTDHDKETWQERFHAERGKFEVGDGGMYTTVDWSALKDFISQEIQRAYGEGAWKQAEHDAKERDLATQRSYQDGGRDTVKEIYKLIFDGDDGITADSTEYGWVELELKHYAEEKGIKE